MTQENKRAFTRIFFDAETVITQGDQLWQVQLLDISLRGVLVDMLPGQALDSRQPADISIHLGGDIQICMTGHVANARDNKVGLTCDFIDIDSMTHLRRLVELNTGDTSLLERELHLLA